jgi:pyruvate formate lyase activating enzyme
VWLRYVLVPGLTDDAGELEQIAKFVADLGNVERVDVLPFHQMGRYKWHQLGIPYSLENVSPPANELVEQVCAVFRSAGLQTH